MAAKCAIYKNLLRISDSAYKKNADGLSLAVSRCNYLTKRKKAAGRKPD